MKKIGSSIKASVLCYSVSLAIFGLIYYEGMHLQPGDEMGYCLLYLYTIMPLSASIISYIIGLKRGRLFWFYPIFCGFLGEFIPFKIFGSFDIVGMVFALIPALIGIVIGFKTSIQNVGGKQ